MLEGVAMYIDNQKLKFVHSVIASGKTLEKVHQDCESISKNSSTNFRKEYPFKKPSNPELRGWSGTFGSLDLCIGVGIRRDASNDCLVRQDGLLVWLEWTMIKLGGEEKRLRFALQMFQLLYSLMMGDDAIFDATPFAQYLGTLNV